MSEPITQAADVSADQPQHPPRPARPRRRTPWSSRSCWSRTSRSTACAASTRRRRVPPDERLRSRPRAGGVDHERRPAAGALRRARLPLRHPPPLVPEEPPAATRWCGRSPSTRRRERPARAAGVAEAELAQLPRARSATLAAHRHDRRTGSHERRRRPESGSSSSSSPASTRRSASPGSSPTPATSPASTASRAPGRRDPRELTTAEAKARDRRARADAGLLRQHRRRRADRAHGLLGAARLRDRAQRRGQVLHQRQPHRRRRSPRGSPPTDYVDVQISLDGATPAVNDARPRRRAPTTPRCARWSTCADGRLRAASRSRSSSPARTSASSTSSRRSPTATAPSCGSPACAPRAAAPTSGTSCTRPPAQQRELYDWLVARGEDVLTGDSFFHLSAYGEALPGLNLCGAGRVVCLIDPVGDVYACPFAIHDAVPRRQRARAAAASRASGGSPSCSPSCAGPQSGGACAIVRLLRRLPRRLHGGEVLHRPAARRPRPRVRARPRRGAARGARRGPRSRRRRSTTRGGAHAPRAARPPRDCDENPLAGSSRPAPG